MTELRTKQHTKQHTAPSAKLPRMFRSLRCFVMWLLVFALPVQGFAASTMLLCSAGHHGTAPASKGGHDHASHGHMVTHGAQVASVGSGSLAQHDHAAQATAADQESPVSPLVAKHAKVSGKCSACAACCTVAFLPTTVVPFTVPAPGHVLPVVELITRSGFIADGPERPPRLHLA